MMTRIKGASNAKARNELDWTPRYGSWRQGFATGLTPESATTAAAALPIGIVVARDGGGLPATMFDIHPPGT
jgi:hypothetical protein